MVVESLWQPPSLPWCTPKSIWIEDEDGQPEEVSLQSPRLLQASKDVGVPFEELVVRDASEFRQRGLSKAVAKVRFELFDQRRMAKLWMVVNTRGAVVQKEIADAKAAKEAAMGQPQFDVKVEVAKPPSMMEKAQANMDKMLQSAAQRAAQAEKARVENAALQAESAEAQAQRNERIAERERERERELKQRRRAAAREARKRARKKEEDAELEELNDERLLAAFAEREVQLEQAIAQRKAKHEERRAAGIRVQQRAKARVALRQEAAQLAKEEMMAEAEAKAKNQAESLRLKRQEAHMEMVAQNERKMEQQAARMADKQDREIAQLEAQKIQVEEMSEQAAQRVKVAKQRQMDRIAQSRQRRLDLAVRKRDRQRVVASVVIQMKEQAQMRAEDKLWQQEDRQKAIEIDRQVRAECNRMRLENKFDEVRRINRLKDYQKKQTQQLAMEKKERIAEHNAQKKQMFEETRKLIIGAQYSKERAELEESLRQWRPKGGGPADNSTPSDDANGSGIDDSDTGGRSTIGRSKSQSWSSKRLSCGEPLFETCAHRRRSGAMLDPIAVQGKDRQARIHAILDFRPNVIDMDKSTLPSPRVSDGMSKSTLSTLIA